MDYTICIVIPEPLIAHIDERVAAWKYGNRSEYICDLIRRDQRERSKDRLRSLVEEGLASGQAAPLSQGDWDEVDAIARGDVR